MSADLRPSLRVGSMFAGIGAGSMIRGLTQDVELSKSGDAGNPGSRQVPAPPSRGVSSRQCAPGPGSRDDAARPLASSVIGVICAGDLAVHRDKVKAALQQGMEQHPDAVWVCVEKKSDRVTHDVMISLGMDPVVLPLNDWWRVRGTTPDGTEVNYDGRRTWRDLEMGSLCDQLVIFHKASSKSHWRDRAEKSDKLVIVDLGKRKAA